MCLCVGNIGNNMGGEEMETGTIIFQVFSTVMPNKCLWRNNYAWQGVTTINFV